MEKKVQNHASISVPPKKLSVACCLTCKKLEMWHYFTKKWGRCNIILIKIYVCMYILELSTLHEKLGRKKISEKW